MEAGTSRDPEGASAPDGGRAGAARTPTTSQAERLERLASLTAVLSEALTPAQAAREIIEEAVHLLAAAAGQVAVFDGEDGALEVIAGTGADADHSVGDAIATLARSLRGAAVYDSSSPP